MEDTIQEIKLDSMKLDDLNEILEIEMLSFAVPWSKDSFVSELTKNKLASYIVAKYNDKVAGYAGMWRVIDEGHITNIAVHPDQRRKKIGSTMVQGLIDLAIQHNITKLTLEVRKSNVSAQNLYEKFGFKIEGIRKKYYSDNKEDALIMWKVVN